jgi:hypothetical protein
VNERAFDESCELDVQVRGPTLVLDDGGDAVRSMQLLYVVPALVSLSCLVVAFACRLSDHPSRRVLRRSLRGQPCLDANAASASACLVALLRCCGPALFQPSLILDTCPLSHSCPPCPVCAFCGKQTGRLLRFAGNRMHAVPRPTLAYLDPALGGSNDVLWTRKRRKADGSCDESTIYRRSVLLFNSWAEPPTNVPLLNHHLKVRVPRLAVLTATVSSPSEPSTCPALCAQRLFQMS